MPGSREQRTSRHPACPTILRSPPCFLRGPRPRGTPKRRRTVQQSLWPGDEPKAAAVPLFGERQGSWLQDRFAQRAWSSTSMHYALGSETEIGKLKLEIRSQKLEIRKMKQEVLRREEIHAPTGSW